MCDKALAEMRLRTFARLLALNAPKEMLETASRQVLKSARDTEMENAEKISEYDRLFLAYRRFVDMPQSDEV